MKTTQGKAVAAFSALNKMARRPMGSFAAYKLFRLKKALRDIVDFQAEQESKLLDELGGTYTEDGNGKFETTEKAEEFIERHKELENMECEIETERIVMYMKEIPEISLAEMEILETFIDWKE